MVYAHVMVPLDGSHLSEAALPAARCFADRLGARVTLVHVVERRPPEEVHGERHLREAAEAQAYLEEVAHAALGGLAHVTWRVVEQQAADVAPRLVATAAEIGADLVAMCTHGRGGLRRLLLGSIAEKVVAEGETPVLLVQPSSGSEGPFACRRLLLPLDGVAEHERSVPVAAALARALGAQVHLAVVVPTPATLPPGQAAASRLLPGATRAVLEMSAQAAADYLESLTRTLTAQGIEVTAEVARGAPARAIREVAEAAAADLIVLSSHRRGGLDAFLTGSIAPEVARHRGVPVLLVPIPGA
jgi:nucleotide-binding universal stress UspA family protein